MLTICNHSSCWPWWRQGVVCAVGEFCALWLWFITWAGIIAFSCYGNFAFHILHINIIPKRIQKHSKHVFLYFWSDQLEFYMLISHDAKMQVVWQHLCCCRSKLMCGLVCPCATFVVRRVPRIILPFTVVFWVINWDSGVNCFWRSSKPKYLNVPGDSFHSSIKTH